MTAAEELRARVVEVIEHQEARALQRAQCAATMTAHQPSASALATATRLVAIAEGVEAVTTHLRGAFHVTYAELPHPATVSGTEDSGGE